jgi:hypothetical protein
LDWECGRHEKEEHCIQGFVRKEDNIKMSLVSILLGACERDSFDSGWGPEVRSCGPGFVP